MSRGALGLLCLEIIAQCSSSTVIRLAQLQKTQELSRGLRVAAPSYDVRATGRERPSSAQSIQNGALPFNLYCSVLEAV